MSSELHEASSVDDWPSASVRMTLALSIGFIGTMFCFVSDFK